MAFLEFIGTIIAVILVIVLCLGALGVYVGFAIAAASFLLATGWIPIFMCATDYHMNIGTGFVGTWAMYSIFVYSATSALFLAVMVIRPDPDGLPPAWKFLALLYKYETVEIANATASGSEFDAKKFSTAANKPAQSTYQSIDEARKLEAANKKLQAEVNRKEESRKAAEVAMKIEILKAEEAELKKQREKLEKETRKRHE